MKEWISANVPPKQSGHYLCTIATDEGACVVSLDYHAGAGDWIHEGEPTFCKGYYFNPKFWMELPEPAQLDPEDDE